MRKSLSLATFGLVAQVALLAGCGHPQSLLDHKTFDSQAGVLWSNRAAPATDKELKKIHPILIVDVTVIDGTGAAPVLNQDVLIEKGKITQISPTGEIIPPKGTEKIKGAGATLLPGLIDVLGFASIGGGPVWQRGTVSEERFVQSNLYAGVTTLVAGGNYTKLAELRDQMKAGEVIGPRLFLASPIITVTEGYPADLGGVVRPWWQLFGGVDVVREVETPGECKAAVNELAAEKVSFDFIPIVVDATPGGFPQLAADALQVCLDVTRSRGRKSMVFTGRVEDVVKAVNGKATAIVHGVYGEPLTPETAAKLARLLQVSGISYIPSLVELWGTGSSVSGQSFPTVLLEKETTEPDILAAFSVVPGSSSGMLFKYAQTLGPQLPVAADNLNKLAAWRSENNEKLNILTGSLAAAPGVFPGAALHRELGFMVKAGMSPVDAIASATGKAARLVAREDDPKFGTIAVDKIADLLLVSGDVVADISNTQRIRAVILGGRILDRIPLGTTSGPAPADQEAAKGPAADSAAGPAAGPAAAPGEKNDEPPPVEALPVKKKAQPKKSADADDEVE